MVIRQFDSLPKTWKTCAPRMQGFMELARKIGSREIPDDQAFGMLH
ncbi:hypothetical protein [Acetobacterium sp.]